MYKKFEITSSVPHYIEFVKKGSKKYNIKSSEVIAIGDGENDLEMIKYAGLGIAMGKMQWIY